MVIQIELTMFLEDGKLIVIDKHEVENLALETVGIAEDIYSEKTQINKELYLKYDSGLEAWVLHTNHKHTG